MLERIPTLSHRALVAAATVRFEQVGIDSARLDAEVLLGYAAGYGRCGVLARAQDPVSVEVEARFDAAVDRRVRREPVAYIVGRKEFYSRDFIVSPAVLIPRPETELLVERTLARANAGARVIEVGTGSGCIAVTLAAENPTLRLTAIDLSADALSIAHGNARLHGVDDRIDFVLCDLVGGLACTPICDLVVSNPPYVAAEEFLAGELSYEPELALRAGSDGMRVVGRLLREAIVLLRAGGCTIVEIGAEQGAAARDAALAAGYRRASVELDLAGRSRCLVAERE